MIFFERISKQLTPLAMSFVTKKKIKRTIRLILINIQATYFRLFESIRVIFKYYPTKFLFLDLMLLKEYLFKNPHRVSRDFLIKSGKKNIYVYGETPLTTLDKVCTSFQILSHDTVYELGSGSGRTSFWLHSFIQCKVRGIDHLPEFIEKAERVKKAFRLHGIEFLKEDMFQLDMSKATVIYLYGTCLKDREIRRLITQFKELPRTTRIITVSYPLSDFDKDFSTQKKIEGSFPWGKTEIYLNSLNP